MDAPLLARATVCLVGTANPENLGAVARLCANFDVAPPLLVAPRAAPDDPRALVVGRPGRERLTAATVVGGLDEALAGCAYAVAFSARRGAGRPAVGLRALPSLLAARAPAGRVALVFGPEDSGLARADVDRCDVVATIETPGPLPSLNLAQAVALALWELARPVDAAPPGPAPGRGGATRAELDALVEHALDALAALGQGGGDRARRAVHLRRILAAAALRPDEVRALHGLCVAVLRAVAHD